MDELSGKHSENLEEINSRDHCSACGNRNSTSFPGTGYPYALQLSSLWMSRKRNKFGPEVVYSKFS